MFENIKAIVMDVDGVLTDGSVLIGEDGSEQKRFCYADKTGIELALKHGLKIAMISGNSSSRSMLILAAFLNKLIGGNDVLAFWEKDNKADVLRTIAERHGLGLSEVCYIGDDLIDIPAMNIAGVSVAPYDAQRLAFAAAKYWSRTNGGQGVVREVVDLVLESGQ